MPGRKHTTPVAVLMSLALVIGLALTGVPQRAEAATVPGMRPNYVFAFLATRPNATMLRMGTMQFRPSGRVYQKIWEWNQAWAPSPRNVYKYRANTGYTTSGCGPKPCPVWTASTFDKPGTSRVGVWKLTHRGTRVQINFGNRNQFYEAYALASYATYTKLTLVSSNYPGYTYFFGSAYGSKVSINRGARLDQIRAPGSPTQNGLNYELITDNWDSAIEKKKSVMWWNSPGNYLRCSRTCMKGARPDVWHSYIVADPLNLGRKMYWYHQLSSVARSKTCANAVYGGHTVQLLQILDDNGQFIGMIGGEASILARYRGGSIMSYFVGFRF